MTPMSFLDYQLALTRHLRDPDGSPRPPGVDPERAALYAGLLRNTAHGFLDRAFPVLRDVVGAGAWDGLVRAFLREHRCRSPLFKDIPRAFVDFLSGCEAASPPLPVFAVELAHYEWLELKVDLDPRPVRRAHAAVDDARPVRLNPGLQLQAYRFPVHRIGADFQPTAAPELPTFLVVWRTREHEVRFMDLSAAAVRLLQALSEGTEPAAAIAGLFGTRRDRAAAKQCLEEWIAVDIVLGNRRAPGRT